MLQSAWTECSQQWLLAIRESRHISYPGLVSSSENFRAECKTCTLTRHQCLSAPTHLVRFLQGTYMPTHVCTTHARDGWPAVTRSGPCTPRECSGHAVVQHTPRREIFTTLQREQRYSPHHMGPPSAASAPVCAAVCVHNELAWVDVVHSQLQACRQ